MDYIKLKIRRSELNGDGRYRTATVRGIEHSASGTLGEGYEKYLPDIIMHALSWVQGVEVKNEQFTYTFPFRLG